MNRILENYRKIILAGLLGFICSQLTTQRIFEFVLRGKSFAGRSQVIQWGLILIAALGYAAALYLLGWVIARSATVRRIAVRASGILDSVLVYINNLKPILWLAWIVVGGAGLVMLFLHLRLVFFPYQMEYREGAILLTGQAFLQGINPWQLDVNPIYINVYGFVYNLVALPFTWILGNRLWIYRLITFLSILGQTAVIARVMRRKGLAWIWAAYAGLFIWIGQFYYTTPMARPDGLGQLLFLLTLYLPIMERYSTRSLVWSAVFGLLGFYTKPYFLLGIPLVTAYVFLFESKRKAVLYAGGAFIVFLLSALLVNRIFEAYFFNVYFSHVADTNQIYEYMIQQTIKFGRDYWALLIFAGFGLLGFLFETPAKDLRLNLRPVNSGLFNRKPDFSLFILLISAALIYFSLGRHNGTIQAYYYQLLTPFLVIVVPDYLWIHPRWQNVALILVGINLVNHSVENLASDWAGYESESMTRFEQILEGHSVVMNSPAVVAELVYRGLPVENSGQSEYFFPYPERQLSIYPALDRIKAIGDSYLTSEKEKMQSGEFDLLMLEGADRKFMEDPLIAQKYQFVDTITFVMPHVFQTWQADIYTVKP
jgi:hypothetical protein